MEINLDKLLDFKIDELEVDEKIEEVSPKEVEVIESEGRDQDLEVDYEKTRAKYYELLDKGTEALEGMLEVAKQTDEARAYEVVGQLLKNTSEVNREIVELQKRMEEIKVIDKKIKPSKVTNALFVGSTADLQKMIKKNE
tara:strand:+ start:76 stop:495 length:420 start_codon:yes stop_codon:yes gene_type:complete